MISNRARRAPFGALLQVAAGAAYFSVLLAAVGSLAFGAQSPPAGTQAATPPAAASPTTSATPPAASSPPNSAASPPPSRPPTARTQAPFDPTGYWVSVVTQNWRFRMVVPGRGEYVDIPINLKAKQYADAWSAAADEAAGKQCEAYGAAALMRIPERLHIGWQDDSTLKIDTDAGMQTRLLRFKPAAEDASQAPSWQGYSAAQWLLHPRPAAAAQAPSFGSIEVVTDRMLPGLLRKNGIPYSSGARMTEYWEVDSEADEVQWLIITTELEDPEYLRGTYIFNSIFRKEADGSGWDPAPCTLRE